MANAKQLPSGRWRTLVYTHTDERGKRHYKSFTADKRKESERLASMYTASDEAQDERESTRITFKEAFEDLMASKSNVLSPYTLSSYRGLMHDGTDFDDKPVTKLTQNDIQKFINKHAETHKPKTVRNMHGLIVSVIHSVRPDMVINTTLPQKERYDPTVPEDADVKELIAAATGDLKKSILLAALGPMRCGEICALQYEDINYKTNTVHVHANMVKKDYEYIIKPVPKTFAGDRYITYPKQVIKELGKGTGPVIQLNPNQVGKHYRKLQKQLGITKFRFHDLRHYSASIQHALGVPDAYIMQRGGWKSDHVLKTVYRHALGDESKKLNNKINKHFDTLF